MPENRIASRTIFTCLTIAFLIHNTEETIALRYFPVKNPFTFIQPLDFLQFLFAVSLLSLVGVLVFAFAMLTKNRNNYLLISTAMASVIVFNALIPHIFVAVFTLRYTPGIISAILLNLPLGLLLLQKNKNFYCQRKQMIGHVIIGFVAGYSIFAITMLAAKLFF